MLTTILGYCTVTNLTFAIVVFTALWTVLESLLKYISPMTSTLLDDRLLAYMQALDGKITSVQENAWLKENSPKLWQAVEDLSQTTVPQLKGAAKLAMMLKMAHDAYIAAHGKDISAIGIKQLEAVATELSAKAKTQ